MRIKKKKLVSLFLIAGFVIICCLLWIFSRETQDSLRELLTSNNSAQGLFSPKKVQWCTLPLSYDLDKGGVPDSIQDITHPSICYIPNKAFPHSWWIAATPYPQSLKVHGEPYENTCIFYADNDISIPPTSFQPIKKNPIIYKEDAKYNSDPDIFFDDVDSTLYAVTRKRRGANYLSKIVIQSSQDGEGWTQPIPIVQTETASLCPCLIKADSATYRLYLFETKKEKQNPTSSIEVWESSSLSNPHFEYKKSIPWTLNSNFWHGDIVLYKGKYYMIYCGTNKNYKTLIGTIDEAKYLWVAVSDDGYNFKEYRRPILKMNGVYRSTFTIIQDVVYCYFSVANRYLGDRRRYPYGNRIGYISFNLDDLRELE